MQYIDGTHHSIPSPIYKWNGTSFNMAQTVMTHAAVRWLHLTCPPAPSSPSWDPLLGSPTINFQQHILAVLQAPPSSVLSDANLTGTDTTVTRLAFYRLDEDNQTFAWMQVSTYGLIAASWISPVVYVFMFQFI